MDTGWPRTAVLTAAIATIGVVLLALRLTDHNDMMPKSVDNAPLAKMSIEGLKLGFSYPQSWGQASISSGSSGLDCDYDVSFTQEQDIHICAYTLQEARNCIGPCDAFVDEASFKDDLSILNSSAMSTSCSSKGIDCRVIETPFH